jgi:hypothetical protein
MVRRASIREPESLDSGAVNDASGASLDLSGGDSGSTSGTGNSSGSGDGPAPVRVSGGSRSGGSRSSSDETSDFDVGRDGILLTLQKLLDVHPYYVYGGTALGAIILLLIIKRKKR